MDIQSAVIFESRMHMLGMTDRSLPMLFKHQLTYPSFCGSRNGWRLVTIAQRGRYGHVPSLSHSFGDRRHQTAGDTRLLARQTLRIGPLDDRLCGFLFFQGFENMLNHPFFFIGQWSASFTWTFKLPKMSMIHAKLTQQGMHCRCAIRPYLVTGGEKNARFYSILCCRAQ